jgi:hypothetical protein
MFSRLVRGLIATEGLAVDAAEARALFDHAAECDLQDATAEAAKASTAASGWKPFSGLCLPWDFRVPSLNRSPYI